MSAKTDVRPDAGLAVSVTAAVAVVTMVRALVVAHLWQWFVADPFGAPRLSVAEVAGLILVLLFVVDLLPDPRTDKAPPTHAEIVHRVIARMINAGTTFLFALVLVRFR